MIPHFESLLADLARAVARASGLGPEGATTLARVLTIVTTLILGWVAYRLAAGVITGCCGPWKARPTTARASSAPARSTR